MWEFPSTSSAFVRSHSSFNRCQQHLFFRPQIADFCFGYKSSSLTLFFSVILLRYVFSLSVPWTLQNLQPLPDWSVHTSGMNPPACWIPVKRYFSLLHSIFGHCVQGSLVLSLIEAVCSCLEAEGSHKAVVKTTCLFQTSHHLCLCFYFEEHWQYLVVISFHCILRKLSQCGWFWHRYQANKQSHAGTCFITDTIAMGWCCFLY